MNRQERYHPQAPTNPGQNNSTDASGVWSDFLTKQELAAHLRVSVRFVEKLVAARKIPICRIARRCVRFSRQRVERALSRYEVGAILMDKQERHEDMTTS